jgi:hypothetical protein
MGFAFGNNDLPAVEMRALGASRLTLGLTDTGAGLALNAVDGDPRLTLQSGETNSAITFDAGRLRLESNQGGAAAVQLRGDAGTIQLRTDSTAAPVINSTTLPQ